VSQPILDGMPERLYPAAPSRLTTYVACPRRYRLAYLDRPTPARAAPWGHNSVGASVHTALARWWALPRERRTPEAGGALLVDGWLTDGFRDRAQLERARERSRRQVERYLADVDPDAEPAGVERTVSVRTRRASLWGRVDRVDDRAGTGLVVVDYKTGRSAPSASDARASLALAVYAAAAARTWRRLCTRVELHHLPTGDVAAWDHTPESLDRHLDRADAVAAELGVLRDRTGAGMSRPEADELFPVRVGSRCGWCDFRAVCGPGQAVPRQEPWAGVVDP
jgi:CRISPR/Cas system-associated exonuclease Cas4 (RecB family)